MIRSSPWGLLLGAYARCCTGSGQSSVAGGASNNGADVSACRPPRRGCAGFRPVSDGNFRALILLGPPLIRLLIRLMPVFCAEMLAAPIVASPMVHSADFGDER